MLIVKDIVVRPWRALLVTPFRIATGQHDSLDNLLFVVELVNGVKGFGESAVATHITGETVAVTAANLKEAGAALIGEDISDYRAVLYGFRERLEGNHAALAAVEMAVLDAVTRSLKIPLWALWGMAPARFRTDITIVIGTCEEAALSAKAYSRQGFKTFKVKIGKDKDLDLARVLAVHEAAPRAGILLDANQGFSVAQMLQFLKRIRARGVDPLLLEQPVPKADVDGLKALTRLAKVPVCADESAGSLESVVRLLNAGAVNAVNVKLMKSGILEAVAIAQLSRAKGAKLMMGAMMESALAITAAAHVAAGLGCFDFIDLDTTFFIKGRLSRAPGLDARGCFDLTKSPPGIGVSPSLLTSQRTLA